jgi:four helix bundle protein
MDPKHHEDLAVWRTAHQHTIEIYTATKAFPREELYGLVAQLRRASAGIPTNLAEGAARRSRREFAQFVAIARGSASEMGYLLLLSRDLGYIGIEQHQQLSERLNHISRMLTNLMRGLAP